MGRGPSRTRNVKRNAVNSSLALIDRERGGDAYRRLTGILSANEIDFVTKLKVDRNGWRSGISPSLTLIMKATRLCNLRCKYCHSWRSSPSRPMSFETMATATWDVLGHPQVKVVDFVWHGGEVTLLPISFFEKALYVQLLLKRPDQVTRNAIQTNATLISEEWLSFWKDHDFEIGVSIDGTPSLHESRRVDKAGRGTWSAVVAGIGKLRAAGVRFGALAVLTEECLAVDPRRYLQSLVNAGVDAVALLNAIPQASGEVGANEDYFVFDRFIDYLVQLYETWNDEFRSSIRIREFESLENNHAGRKSLICVHSASCMGKFLTVEPDGRIAPCDKYDGDKNFHFSDLSRSGLADAVLQAPGMRALREEERSLKLSMQDCEFNRVCRGGCPHDARMRAQSGLPRDCCGLRPLIQAIDKQKGGTANGTGNFSY